jgi:glycosyltransferase involved in cell wall biosynthesis
MRGLLNPMRRVLMVAYHFPPLAGSSGIQRTLRFVQQLPRFGWEALVLTVNPGAYERTSADLDAEVPSATIVRRALALDASRHLSIAGRHIAAMARPDRWANWRHMGVRMGLSMIRDFAPQAIWSTYPIPTAHTIAATLQAHSRLPWVADFRDPMAQDGYPADPRTWAQFRAIEARAMEHAHFNVFTTPGAAEVYRHRYAHAGQRIVVIENGYDEPSFSAAETDATDHSAINPGFMTLLHSGIVYPEERDPTALFAALQNLHLSAPGIASRLKIRFRAAVHDELLLAMAARHQVQHMIELAPPTAYKAALAEMMRADGLLLLQAANCNQQIPAKLYEYLRAGPPIIALTDPAGDTADALRRSGVVSTARLDDAGEISTLLKRLLEADRTGLLPRPDAVRAASRHARTSELAVLLDAAAGIQR